MQMWISFYLSLLVYVVLPLTVHKLLESKEHWSFISFINSLWILQIFKYNFPPFVLLSFWGSEQISLQPFYPSTMLSCFSSHFYVTFWLTPSNFFSSSLLLQLFLIIELLFPQLQFFPSVLFLFVFFQICLVNFLFSNNKNT